MIKVNSEDVKFHLLPQYSGLDVNGKRIKENQRYAISAEISFLSFFTDFYSMIDIEGIVIEMYLAEVENGRIRLISKDIFEEV